MRTVELNIDSFRISYLEKNPNGEKCIFFFHGNSNSNTLWKNQFSASHFNGYHLIAIDLPGHGNSSFSEQPLKDYSVKALAKLMSKIIIALGISKPYILCGFSLGTNVVAEMLAFAISPTGLIFISPTLVGSGIGPGDLNDKEIVGKVLFNANEKNECLDEYFDIAMPANVASEKAGFITCYLSTDKQFREALLQTAINGEFSDEIELVNKSNIPILMLIGVLDKVVKPNVYDAISLFGANVKRVKIAGGHYLPIEIPEILNPLIGNFIDKV